MNVLKDSGANLASIKESLIMREFIQTNTSFVEPLEEAKNGIEVTGLRLKHHSVKDDLKCAVLPNPFCELILWVIP